MDKELCLFICLIIVMMYAIIIVNEVPMNCDHCCSYNNNDFNLWNDDDTQVLIYVQKCNSLCEC